MRPLHYVLALFIIPCCLSACVDAYEPVFDATVNVVVVDGTISNLVEPQFVRLNRSQADPLTGRFGTLPIRKAKVEVVVDGQQVVALFETTDGTYQLPSDFRGRVGSSYQLRFTLDDGERYESSAEVMTTAVPIDRLTHRFDPTSLPPKRPDGQVSRVQAASDIFVDWQDPASTNNYYRWDWKLWEHQDWCRTCSMGYYYVWQPYNESVLREDCYSTGYGGVAYGPSQPYFVNDYRCRTRCWEILYNYDMNLFNDAYSNGGQLSGRRVAQIPYYQDRGCLVEIRQLSLSQSAYVYFQQLQQQTENTGGLADTPPAVPVGNVRNKIDPNEAVVGYFMAAGTSTQRYWLDRTDATGKPPGLFQGLNDIEPSPEEIPVDPNTGQPKGAPGIGGKNGITRPPTAVCVLSDSRTPIKPEGWRD